MPFTGRLPPSPVLLPQGRPGLLGGKSRDRPVLCLVVNGEKQVQGRPWEGVTPSPCPIGGPMRVTGKEPSPGPQEWGGHFQASLTPRPRGSQQALGSAHVYGYSREDREPPAGAWQARPPPQLWAVSLPLCPSSPGERSMCLHRRQSLPWKPGSPAPRGKLGLKLTQSVPEAHTYLTGWAASPEGGRLGLCLRGVISTELSTAQMSRAMGPRGSADFQAAYTVVSA